MTALDRCASGISIWVLRSTGVGADRQMLNLAAALGGQARVIDVLDPPVRAVLDRLVPGRGRSIPEHKQSLLAPPWPDLVLFSGGGSLIDAERIRHASGGHARIVCLGRIGASLDRVDLLLTTPQYCLPAHPRVVHLELPLNWVDRDTLDAAARGWRDTFDALPRPWHGVMVGGPSGSYRFDAAVGRELGRQLQALIGRLGGSLLITTSPRTDPEAIQALEREIEAPSWCYRWQPADPDNPLTALLALADDLVVTADSASMLAEACSLEKPVAVFEPPLKWPARMLARSRLPVALARRWRPSRDRLTRAGRWIPARRMERIHRLLIQNGSVVALDDLDHDRFRSSGTSGHDDLERAVEAVRRVLQGSSGPST